jgi:hypothetical protein
MDVHPTKNVSIGIDPYPYNTRILEEPKTPTSPLPLLQLPLLTVVDPYRSVVGAGAE